MKIFISIVILMLFSCVERRKGNQINEDCFLVEATQIRASCGVRSVWVGMKFKKLGTNITFIGLIHCPDGYTLGEKDMDFFAPAKIYKIVAKKPLDIPKGDVVLNAYSDSGLSIYRIDEIMIK